MESCYCLAGGHPIEFDTTPRQIKDAGGCVVGTIDIIDCVSSSESPWFFCNYGFVLRNPVVFPEPIPCKGALGFFEVPEEVHQRAISFKRVNA